VKNGRPVFVNSFAEPLAAKLRRQRTATGSGASPGSQQPTAAGPPVRTGAAIVPGALRKKRKTIKVLPVGFELHPNC